MHPLDAVNLLLQRNRHRRLHHLRVGADVVACHRYLGRRQRRIERDRQRRNRHRASQNDQQRADSGKNRPSNKKVDQGCFFLLPVAAPRRCLLRNAL